MKKIVLFLIFSVFAFNQAYSETIKLGIMAGPSEKIFRDLKKVSYEKYNMNLDLYVFTDYQIPNEALNSGDIDANLFQTQEFLNSAISAKGYEITAIAQTFIYPMGIYSRKIKNLSELKNKDTIIIPNDMSNQSRALLLLKNAGIIELKSNKNLFNVSDIEKNKKNIKIFPMNAAQIARSVYDATAVVLNNDFVTSAGFNFNESLFHESPENSKPFINVLAVKIKNKNDFKFKELIKIINSENFENNVRSVFPGAIKAW